VVIPHFGIKKIKGSSKNFIYNIIFQQIFYKKDVKVHVVINTTDGYGLKPLFSKKILNP